MQPGPVKGIVTEGKMQPILAHGFYVLLCEPFKINLKGGLQCNGLITCFICR